MAVTGIGIGLALAGTTSRAAVAGDDPWPAFDGIPGTTVRFAGLETARGLLATGDLWASSTGTVNREVTMRQPGPVSVDAFLQWNARSAVEYPAWMHARMLAALTDIAPAIARLRLPLPPTVWMVASSGVESSNLPYTRGDAVVLPLAARLPPADDAFVMAHELWHIVARGDPALASRLYEELGFTEMSPLQYPQAWLDLRIANPDAPSNAHAMKVEIEGRTTWITPLLVARKRQIEPSDTLFSLLEVRLLEVEPAAGAPFSQAVIKDGQPLWHAIGAVPAYARALGANTQYIIHPEEALADNIAIMVTGRKAADTALLGRLERVLARR